MTTVTRTLLDLAATISHEPLRRALEEAERLGLLDLEALKRLLERTRGHHGRRRLRELLAYADPAPEVRSELERRFLRLCEAAALPRPAVNARIVGREVDMLWQRERLVVELDGFAYHRSRTAFELDRRRDIELQLAGFRVLRVTARRLEREPSAVIGAIRAMLR